MIYWTQRRSSIRQQLTNVVVFTSVLGLAIACAAFQLYERASYRQALTEEVTALADTVGANSTAPLAFEDQKAAAEVLGGLRAEPHIAGAYLYNSEGQVFAEYRRTGGKNTTPMAFREEEGAQFNRESLILRRSIVFNGGKIGAIAIIYELTEFHAKMRRYTGISAIVLVFSVLATLLLSSRLLRLITEPILALAEVAGKVTAEKDYTLRAVAWTDDEVGKLVQSFNQMLERIQERDTALQEAKDELEHRVEKRTAELRSEVNERKEAEEKLQTSLKELEDLKFAMDQHCIVARTDPRGVITFVNEKFCTVSKYAPEELIGQTHAMINSKYHSREFVADLWETITSGRTWKGEVRNRAKDGSYYWADTTIVPFCDANGKPIQFITIRKEITDLKRIEEELRAAKDVAERASRAKSEFLANMSHEIRTPLNGIMGMTDLALDTQLTQEQREYLETVKNSSDSLLTVINDILDFSKIEAGRLDLESLGFDFREAVETTLRTLALRAHEKELELLCEIGADIPEIVRGDAARLRQVITNLVGNAIKFTDRGEVAVKAEMEQGSGGEILVHFTVSDTGVGIVASKLKMIFDPFFQADTSTTRKYGGTGLGLTISARLVQMMGGRIWAESEVGRGSKFHFTVKLGSGERQESRSSKGLPEKLRGLRVLVAEDNAVNQRLIVRLLEKRGHRVTLANNGREAVSAVEGENFDLVFMDMQMPEVDGFEATAAIRARERSGAAHLPIIALTAHAMKGDREKCLASGMDDYLTKPIQPRELDEILVRWAARAPVKA